MAKSKITITFNSMPSQGSQIVISNNLSSIDLSEVFVNLRTRSGQTTLPPLNPNYDPNQMEQEVGNTEYLGTVADNYAEALRLDYNVTNLYSIGALMGIDAYELGLGTVIITANQSNVIFTEVSNTAGATITIENETEASSLKITNITYSEAATNKCDRVVANFHSNNQIATINGESVSGNPAPFEFLRELKTYVTIVDIFGTTARQLIATPGKLVGSKLSVGVTNSPNGATATVSGGQINGLTLQYSLDNTNWQSSNTFPELASGNYTLYVKDHLGCSVTKTFTVVDYEDVGSGVGLNEPFAMLPSKANSIRFKREVVWDDCSVYKTDENTLSCEVDTNVVYKEIQRFQTCDNEPVQIKSNYENIDVSVINLTDTGNPVESIPVFKRSNYMNLKETRDAIRYRLNDGRTGVYFTSGNIYEYGSTNTIIDTYTLNGGLPKWARIGNYVQVNGAWFSIVSIVYDETKFAEVIVLDDTNASGDETVKITCIYNIFNFEVYEFNINFASYENKRLQVKIVETDPDFPTTTFLSEVIDIRKRHDKTLEIVYFNEDNTDINYGTGIKFKLRIPYLVMKGVSEGESEIHKTDVSAVLLKAESYEADEIQFEPMTKELWRKVQIALSHSYVTINGQGYLKLGEFGTEGPLGESNLYVLTATMIKTDHVYNTYIGDTIYIDGTEQEIPSILSIDDLNNFIEL